MSFDRVLITGGAGFIGRALVEHSLKNGCHVTVIDNFSAGRREHLVPFRHEIKILEGDVLDQTFVRNSMAQSRPDAVFHLAAHHFIPYCNTHPNETIRVNVEGTHVVLSEAARASARVATLASTGAIYPSQVEPLSEDVSPNPRDVYSLSKYLAENVARFVAETMGLACVVTRLFNTYGPYETNPHLIPHIVDSLQNGPFVKLGNTQTKRDYIFVEDVAEIIFAIARAHAAPLEIVNVGTGAEYSAKDIIDFISLITSQEIEVLIEQERFRAADKMHQRADIQRMEALAGIRPRHSIDDGLQKLLRHHDLI